MNILFLTMSGITSISSNGIYEDLMREFILNNNDVYIAAPAEKRYKEKTNLIKEDKCRILRIQTGNLQKVGFIEKGIATLKVTSQFKSAIKKYFKSVKFDLIIYSTPPITLDKVVKFIKKRDNAKTFLLLKDIFPQNAIDLGILSTGGLKGIIYRYFKKKETRLYSLSDNIGCMSEANRDYLLKHNPKLDKNRVCIVHNSIYPHIVELTADEKKSMRDKYGLPQDKKIFIYGGNLGKPQAIPFVIECVKACSGIDDAYFFIVGDGTEYEKLEQFVEIDKPKNLKVLKRLPKSDFDTMLAACNVGLIFLDYRFTIPNYPSRILSYMQAGLPVLACTDPNTDVGKDIVEGGFGWQCESNNAEKFAEAVNTALTSLQGKGDKAVEYLKEHFTVEKSYQTIMQSLKNNTR